MKKYDDSLVEKIHTTDRTVRTFDTEVHLKISPTRKGDGYIDPFEWAVLEQNWAVEQDGVNPFEQDLPLEEKIAVIRDSMGFPNLNLNTMEIITKYETIPAAGREVGLWRHYLRRGSRDPRPCLIYFHGGGYIGGSVYCTENTCRLIAELADAVVFNVDYDLAPEVRFPGAVNECYDIAKYVHSHAEEYGIDPDRISVSGDSAGGNLSAVISLKDRDEGNHYIHQAILLYPAVTFGDCMADGYTWDLDMYEASEEHREVILAASSMFGMPEKLDETSMEACYFADLAEASDPYASPMMAKDHSGLPKTIIMTAEYDGLRPQGEFYGAQLAKAGVDTTIYRYCGCTHAMIDRLGYEPQAEEICLTIAEAL